MGINTVVKHLIDGTTGQVISVNPDLKGLQLAVSGRATGVIKITVKPNGSDVFQEFDPVVTMDLALDRIQKICGFSVSEIQLIPDVAGSDFTVTVTQWPV